MRAPLILTPGLSELGQAMRQTPRNCSFAIVAGSSLESLAAPELLHRLGNCYAIS